MFRPNILILLLFLCCFVDARQKRSRPDIDPENVSAKRTKYGIETPPIVARSSRIGAAASAAPVFVPRNDLAIGARQFVRAVRRSKMRECDKAELRSELSSSSSSSSIICPERNTGKNEASASNVLVGCSPARRRFSGSCEEKEPEGSINIEGTNMKNEDIAVSDQLENPLLRPLDDDDVMQSIWCLVASEMEYWDAALLCSDEEKYPNYDQLKSEKEEIFTKIRTLADDEKFSGNFIDTAWRISEERKSKNPAHFRTKSTASKSSIHHHFNTTDYERYTQGTKTNSVQYCFNRLMQTVTDRLNKDLPVSETTLWKNHYDPSSSAPPSSSLASRWTPHHLSYYRECIRKSVNARTLQLPTWEKPAQVLGDQEAKGQGPANSYRINRPGEKVFISVVIMPLGAVFILDEFGRVIHTFCISGRDNLFRAISQVDTLAEFRAGIILLLKAHFNGGEILCFQPVQIKKVKNKPLKIDKETGKEKFPANRFSDASATFFSDPTLNFEASTARRYEPMVVNDFVTYQAFAGEVELPIRDSHDSLLLVGYTQMFMKRNYGKKQVKGGKFQNDVEQCGHIIPPRMSFALSYPVNTDPINFVSQPSKVNVGNWGKGENILWEWGFENEQKGPSNEYCVNGFYASFVYQTFSEFENNNNKQDDLKGAPTATPFNLVRNLNWGPNSQPNAPDGWINVFYQRALFYRPTKWKRGTVLNPVNCNDGLFQVIKKKVSTDGGPFPRQNIDRSAAFLILKQDGDNDVYTQS